MGYNLTLKMLFTQETVCVAICKMFLLVEHMKKKKKHL